MRDLALDPATGDLDLRAGSDGLRRASLTSGAGAVRQKLALRLGLIAGEYPFDTSIGIPLLTQVIGKASGRDVAEAMYRRAVATCPGVREVESFRFTLAATRRASITFRVIAETGEPVTITDFVAGSVQ